MKERIYEMIEKLKNAYMIKEEDYTVLFIKDFLGSSLKGHPVYLAFCIIKPFISLKKKLHLKVVGSGKENKGREMTGFDVIESYGEELIDGNIRTTLAFFKQNKLNTYFLKREFSSFVNGEFNLFIVPFYIENKEFFVPSDMDKAPDVINAKIYDEKFEIRVLRYPNTLRDFMLDVDAISKLYSFYLLFYKRYMLDNKTGKRKVRKINNSKIEGRILDCLLNYLEEKDFSISDLERFMVYIERDFSHMKKILHSSNY